VTNPWESSLTPSHTVSRGTSTKNKPNSFVVHKNPHELEIRGQPTHIVDSFIQRVNHRISQSTTHSDQSMGSLFSPAQLHNNNSLQWSIFVFQKPDIGNLSHSLSPAHKRYNTIALSGQVDNVSLFHNEGQKGTRDTQRN